MKSKQLIALIALLLGIVGGVLLLVNFLGTIQRLLGGRGEIDIESIITIAIGVIAIVASLMIWKGSYFAGGVINIILGIIAIVYGHRSEGVLILLSGVLGVIAPQIKD
jgi:hypothetical protein